MACIYMIASAFGLDVKIGCSKTSQSLVKRFKTYIGLELVVYVWDIYYDNTREGMGWKDIEYDIHKLFTCNRIWPELEHFHLYSTDHIEWSFSNRANNLMDYYRLNITNFLLGHQNPFLRQAYQFGICTRQHRQRVPMRVEGVHGSLVYVCGCRHLYDYLARQGGLVVDGKKYFNDEIGPVNPNSLMNLTDKFLASMQEREDDTPSPCHGHSESSTEANMKDDTPSPGHGHSESSTEANMKDDTPSPRHGHSEPSAEANLTDRTQVVSYSGSAYSHNSNHTSEMNMQHGNERIESMVRNYVSGTPYLRNRRVVMTDEDDFVNQKVGTLSYPRPVDGRVDILENAGFYDKSIMTALDNRVDRESRTTAPSFTFLFSNYMQLPLSFGPLSVLFSYRLWKQGSLGDDSVFEYKVEFERPSSSAISSLVERQESLVLVKGDPLSTSKMARVQLVSFKPRDYVEAVAFLEGLCKVYASNQYPVVLAINKPHTRDHIVWDVFECEIVKDLHFKFNNDASEYQYIISCRSEWHGMNIAPSKIKTMPPFRGGSILDLEKYEEENGIKEENLSKEEVDKLLKDARRLTRRNRRNRQKHDGDQEGDESESQSSESSQLETESQAVEQRGGVDATIKGDDDDDEDDSGIDNDSRSWEDEDEDDGFDWFPNSERNDQDDGSCESSVANGSESEDDGIDDWLEPPEGTSLNERIAMWITFYGKKGNYFKVGYYYVIE
jgi:hypothetical protein